MHQSSGRITFGLIATVLVSAAILGVTVAILVTVTDWRNSIDGNDECSPAATTLESPSEQECLDVAIIGGGPAGTYAAYRLREQNLKIQLFEQHDRIGGRTYSVPIPGMSRKAELGAMRLRTYYDGVLRRLLDELNLELGNFTSGEDPDEVMFFFRDTLIRQEDFSDPSKIPYNLNSDEEGYSPRGVSMVIANKGIDYSEDDYMKRKSIDGRLLHTIGMWNLNLQYGSKEAVDFINAAQFLEEYYANNMNAGYYYQEPQQNPEDVPPYNLGSYITIEDGFQTVPELLAQNFVDASDEHSVFLSHRLVALNTSTQPYQLVIRDLYSGETKTICAEKIILGIQRKAIKLLEWDLLDKDPLKNNLNSQESVEAVKIYLAYDKPWWRQGGNGEIFDQRRESNASLKMVVTDLPIRSLLEIHVEESENGTEGNSLLLASYASMFNQNFWKGLYRKGTPFENGIRADVEITEEVVDFTNLCLNKIFNISQDDLPKPYTALMQNWGEFDDGESWQTWQPGYDIRQVLQDMPKPFDDKDVYFVGSNFHELNFFVEGALRSVDYIIDNYFNLGF